MADNVNVPISGTGDTGPVKVATDDCGSGGHVGLGKLAISADGDRTLIPADATNGLDVDVTRVVPGTGATHLGKAEDTAHSSGDVGVFILGVRNDALDPISSDNGDYSPIAVDLNGSVAVHGPVTVSGTVTVAGTGTFAVQATCTQSGTWNIGTVTTVTTVSTVTAVTTVGTITNVVHVDDNGGSLTIDGTVAISGTVTVGSHAVTNTGTFAVQAVCAGDVAHDSADSGNPVKVGGRAMTTARTAVADADRVDAAFDVQGRIITERDGPRELDTDAQITLTSTTTETTLKAAIASTFLDLIDLIVINTSATATQVDFRDDTAGTVRFSLYCPAGATVGFSGQRWVQATVNKNWTAKCATSVASVIISGRWRKTK